jgi:hypothetical protein
MILTILRRIDRWKIDAAAEQTARWPRAARRPGPPPIDPGTETASGLPGLGRPAAMPACSQRLRTVPGARSQHPGARCRVRADAGLAEPNQSLTICKQVLVIFIGDLRPGPRDIVIAQAAEIKVHAIRILIIS